MEYDDYKRMRELARGYTTGELLDAVDSVPAGTPLSRAIVHELENREYKRKLGENWKPNPQRELGQALAHKPIKRNKRDGY
jgi:hypothetical protein